MAHDGTRTLTILQINDTHGYLEPHQEMFRKGDRLEHRVVGGYARIKGYFEQVRAERGAGSVIALDNGDTLHGTYAAVHSKGEAFVEPLNALGLDAWTVHWDFVYGPEQLQRITGRLDYPLLACNCHRKSSDELPFAPWLLLERGGVKVGVIGIAAYVIDKTFPEHASEGLYFTLGRHELPRHIRHLREHEGAELIVVLSHLGFPQECKLASEVDGIDILLSGHTHNRMHQPVHVNGATIIQSGCHASFIGRLDVELAPGEKPRITHQLVTLEGEVPQDAQMQQMVDAIYAPHRAMLDEVVGEAVGDLNRYTTLESTMDNLLLDAIASAAGTELAFSNGWRYGAPVPAGAELTMNDLWNIIPTNPPVETVELTGAELRDMMEDNLEKTFSADAYQQMGGFVKRCRGVNIFFKIENAAGLRIQEFFVQGEPLQPDKTYLAAFVTAQGVPKKYGRNRRRVGIDAVEALRRHVQAHRPVRAPLRGTVVAV